VFGKLWKAAKITGTESFRDPQEPKLFFLHWGRNAEKWYWV